MGTSPRGCFGARKLVYTTFTTSSGAEHYLLWFDSSPYGQKRVPLEPRNTSRCHAGPGIMLSPRSIPIRGAGRHLHHLNLFETSRVYTCVSSVACYCRKQAGTTCRRGQAHWDTLLATQRGMVWSHVQGLVRAAV